MAEPAQTESTAAPGPSKRWPRRLALFGVSLLAMIFLGVWIGGYILRWREAQPLQQALARPQTVTLAEFIPDGFQGEDPLRPDQILQTATATKEQVERLRAITEPRLFSLPDITNMGFRCYIPHHRVEIVDADGRRFVFDICFSCNRMKAGDWYDLIPMDWHDPLWRFFADAGMRPRTSDEYHALEDRPQPREEDEAGESQEGASAKP